MVNFQTLPELALFIPSPNHAKTIQLSYHGHNHSNDEGNPGEQNLKRNRSQSTPSESRNPAPIVRENENKDAHNRLRADCQKPEEDPGVKMLSSKSTLLENWDKIKHYLILCWRTSPCRPALGNSLPEHHRWKNPQKYEEKPPHDHDRSWIIEVEHPRKKNNEKGLEFIVRYQSWNDFELDTSHIQETKTVTGKLEEAWLRQNQAAICSEQELSLGSLS